MVNISTDHITKEQVLNFLEEVPDPEIPVLSVVELGIIRDVIIEKKSVIITITPTYSGCPAMNTFEVDIISKLTEKGIPNTKIKTIYHPTWTTDWMSEEAKKKLIVYGIAPPLKGTDNKGVLFSSGEKIIPCPRCGNKNTRLVSQFGSTACKAQYQCNECLEPFDYFKCI